MWPCKFELSWIVPEGLCLSLFLPHSPCIASIQTMNGQGFNYSPHLSDQIQLENEENPRQAQSFLCNVLHGRGHPPCLPGNIFHSLFRDPPESSESSFWRSIPGLCTLCVAFPNVNSSSWWGTERQGILASLRAPDGQCECQKVSLTVSWPSAPLRVHSAYTYTLTHTCMYTHMFLCDGLMGSISRSARVWHSKGRWSLSRGNAYKE